MLTEKASARCPTVNQLNTVLRVCSVVSDAANPRLFSLFGFSGVEVESYDERDVRTGALRR